MVWLGRQQHSVDKAYIVSNWSLYCRNLGYDRFLISQGMDDKRATIEVRNKVVQHIIDSKLGMPNPADVESLTDISQALATKMAEKRKDVVFESNDPTVKSTWARKQKVFTYWENCCRRGARINQLVQLLGVQVLEFSELPWSFVFQGQRR
ncbi:hypothetical protein MP228_007355 [Amoeboaphelidium protococcarum]|nr:hypothetical protein MP228_007355 [Amoeboaphelidium protococcarum]